MPSKEFAFFFLVNLELKLNPFNKNRLKNSLPKSVPIKSAYSLLARIMSKYHFTWKKYFSCKPFNWVFLRFFTSFPVSMCFLKDSIFNWVMKIIFYMNTICRILYGNLMVFFAFIFLIKNNDQYFIMLFL